MVRSNVQASGRDYVRPAQLSDCTRIAQIQVPNMISSLREGTDEELPASAFAQLTPESVQAAWEQTLQRPPAPGAHVLAAVSSEKLVGFAAVSLTEEPRKAATQVGQWPSLAVEISALEVDEGERGNGHGSRLLAAVTELGTESGAGRVQVWVVAGDQARIRFYQGAGLAPAGLRRRLQVGQTSIFEHLWWARLD